MADPERYLALLEALRQALATLVRYRETIPREKLLADPDTQNMVLFAMYRAVQGAIDLGQHYIAENRLPVAAAYRKVFAVLADAGAIDAVLAGRLDAWGGLRNVIAHHYGVIDIALVADALYEELPDLEAFAAAMAKHAPLREG